VTVPPQTKPFEPYLDRHQIDEMCDRGVAATVAYAKAHSPFYREMLTRFPEIHTTAELQSLPLTTKKQVSEFNEQFWCAPRDQFVDLCTTSGTTGTPTLCPLTQADLDRLGYNEQLCFNRLGLSASDTVILAVTLDKCFMAGLAYFEGLRRLGVMAVRVGAGSPAMLLSMIGRLKPTAIVSVPSFLKRVAAYASEQGIDPAKSTVRKIICIGEPIREADFRLTALGAHVAQAWNARMFSTYGITELGCSLCECDAGRGGHMHPDLIFIEILDEQGRPVPDGQTGQLVATTIGAEAMPLIRFATGDITFITNQQCACGRWTPRIGPILARKDQALKIKGTTVHPAAVQRVLNSLEQISDYVMIATAPTALSDELEVVVALRGKANGCLEEIREKLRGELKVTPSIRIATPQEIRDLGQSSELRKQRTLIDRRQPREGASKPSAPSGL
jgi:phenylacetate-CoA ligase